MYCLSVWPSTLQDESTMEGQLEAVLTSSRTSAELRSPKYRNK